MSLAGMLGARLGLLAGRLRGRPSYQDRCRELIARYAPGRSLVDVGCMWNVHGAYAFHALEAGATAVTGMDVMPASAEFRRRNAAAGDRVRYVQGDVNDRRATDAVGPHDVVFCSGVLYHMEDPVFTLRQLRRICAATLILGSAAVPERATPQSLVFLPYLDDGARGRLTYATPAPKAGLDTPFEESLGSANWYWAFTPSAVVAVARAAGFEVLDVHPYRHAVCVVARRR